MFAKNITKASRGNKKYRKVIHTTKDTQLALMCLNPGEDIPEESHGGTQIFKIESGKGIAKIFADKKYKTKKLTEGIILFIPPNTKHYIKNTSTIPLKLYTTYVPPEHPPNASQNRQHYKN